MISSSELCAAPRTVVMDDDGGDTFSKQDVRFAADGGIGLGAWLLIPDGPSGARPAITMAHGYALTKYHGIAPFAEAFAAAGFVVLVHDHRGFGDSGGRPRQDVNPWQQIADWRRAISYLQDRPEVDEERIGLWGTSFSGGHAIVLGATDRRLRAVVAQVPTIDGHAAGQRRVAPAAVGALEATLAADERAQLRGEACRHAADGQPRRRRDLRRSRRARVLPQRCRQDSGKTASPCARRVGRACTHPASSSAASRPPPADRRRRPRQHRPHRPGPRRL